jgi:hypothetical protein
MTNCNIYIFYDVVAGSMTGMQPLWPVVTSMTNCSVYGLTVAFMTGWTCDRIAASLTGCSLYERAAASMIGGSLCYRAVASTTRLWSPWPTAASMTFTTGSILMDFMTDCSLYDLYHRQHPYGLYDRLQPLWPLPPAAALWTLWPAAVSMTFVTSCSLYERLQPVL